MAVKLTCGDGATVRVNREHFERYIFNNPDIAAASSYTLLCKARSEIANALMDLVDGECQTVTITRDNFEELQNLCKELGFRGLDKELRAFRGETGNGSVDLNEFFQLKERVTRQEKRLTELERQLNEVLRWKRKVESVSREFQSLERKVDEVARVCEERNVESSRKTEQALRECAKQSDIEELARGLAQLKQNAVQWLRRREFVCGSSKLLQGVIAHLTRECGGNVHDKGIVNITASSVFEGQPKNAADLGTDSIYHSENEKDTWICYEFKKRRVIPTSYSVRSQSGGPGCRHLKSWVIEVSNDGSLWTEIDRQDNNYDLNGSFATANFKISKVPSKSFRFFRLRQTGLNPYGDYYVDITSLEIFGTLFEK